MGALGLVVPHAGGLRRPLDTTVRSMALRAAGSCVVLGVVVLSSGAPVAGAPPGIRARSATAVGVLRFVPALSIVPATARTLYALPVDVRLLTAVRRPGCEQLTFTSRTLQRELGRPGALLVVEYHSRGSSYDGAHVSSAVTYARSVAGRPAGSCLSVAPG